MALPFEVTGNEKELYHSSGRSGDGASTVYHFTTPEAARSIWEQQAFRVSRDTVKDTELGPGVYVAPQSGEKCTDLQMAQQNFREVTKEALAKSACYFRIKVDPANVLSGRKEGRLVLLVQPGTRGASEIQWSELLAVEGPFFSKWDPAVTLMQACAERLGQERARSCRERAKGFARRVVAILCATTFFGCVAAPAIGALLIPLLTVYIEVPTWLWLRRAKDACVRTFRLPREAAKKAPELGKAARWLFFTWLPRYAAMDAAAGSALSTGSPAAAAFATFLCFVNTWFVAEWTRRHPHNDMVTRLQQAAEETYVSRLAQPAVLAQLRPGMAPADLEQLLGDAEEEVGP